MELLAPVCSIMLPYWTDLRSLRTQQSSTINRQRNAAGRQQGNQPQSTCNVCSTSCVALSAWSLLSLAYGMHSEESVCLSGAGRQHSNPHARRRLDARVELVYHRVEELAMLGSHSQLAETQCMIQLYLQQHLQL
jgi:hypothetical protein